MQVRCFFFSAPGLSRRPPENCQIGEDWRNWQLRAELELLGLTSNFSNVLLVIVMWGKQSKVPESNAGGEWGRHLSVPGEFE